MVKFERVFVFLCIFGFCTAEEPKCSRFDYDKHLLEMLVRLESTMGKMAERMTEIETRFGNLEQRQDVAIQTTATDLQETDKRMTALEARVVNIAVRQDGQDVLINNASQTLQGKFLDLRDQLVNITDHAVHSVGFFAKEPKSAPENGRPIFQKLLYNEGDSYDVSTGMFTCRVAGLYHFTFTFMSKFDSSSPYCTLYLNDSWFVYTHAKGHFNSATMTVYHNLNVGDTVYVTCSDWGNIFVGNGYMWFSGTLMRV